MTDPTTRWREALLPPNPPPTDGVMTRTCANGILSARATGDCSGNGVCVDAQMVSLPSSNLANAVWVSIAAWAT